MTKKPTIAAKPKALEATILLAELPASAEVDGRAAAAARLPEGAALPEGTADSFDITAEEAADGSALDSSVKRASELYEEHCDVAGISAVYGILSGNKVRPKPQWTGGERSRLNST